MRYDLNKSSHSVYSLNYHLILVVKNRKNIFTDKGVISELKYRTRKIAENYNIKIKNQETDKDHTHIIFSTEPTTDLTKFINALKTGTSKAIKHRSNKKDKLRKNTLWSNNYCLVTTGEVTLNQLKQYVENQGGEEGEE